MLHKFCPTCASMDTKRLQNGMEECARCGFRGAMKEGAMDEINRVRKSKAPAFTAVSADSDNGGKPQITNKQLKEKLNSLRGKKTDDFEII